MFMREECFTNCFGDSSRENVKRLSVEDFNKLYSQYKNENKTSSYFIVVNDKMKKILDLKVRQINGGMSDREYLNRFLAILNNTYIHPEWDYWSKPSGLDKWNPYRGAFIEN